jgi:hypothetical protein
LGSNPESINKPKIGDIAKGVANIGTLARKKPVIQADQDRLLWQFQLL